MRTSGRLKGLEAPGEDELCEFSTAVLWAFTNKTGAFVFAFFFECVCEKLDYFCAWFERGSFFPLTRSPDKARWFGVFYSTDSVCNRVKESNKIKSKYSLFTPNSKTRLRHPHCQKFPIACSDPLFSSMLEHPIINAYISTSTPADLFTLLQHQHTYPHFTSYVQTIYIL